MGKEFQYKYEELFNPTIQALKNLGGSGSISEIEDEVSKVLDLSEEEINDIHKESRTKLSYRLAWARTYLKNAGILENSKRGVWVLTQKDDKVGKIDNKKIKKIARKKMNEKDKSDSSGTGTIDDPDSEIDEFNWQDDLLNIIKNIDPTSFEKLCQRMLRELGFKNVEITRKTNDGGIDGRGILRLGGVMSFHIMFQAKRYKDTCILFCCKRFSWCHDGQR
ncbi:MAG: Mrr restriction system protein [Balneolaceae bacterium]|nr:Mrr restriction system protein [Balneolaceae bacterium]